ncbi:MAG: phosphoribosyl-ATP diphosphatase [Spirochaetia bacterium]|nr:phosphoribosyl-ATP diphosphatase [Spirochaetia bacterium]
MEKKENTELSHPLDFLIELQKILKERQENPAPDSYTNKLLTQGYDKVLQKVGEEAVEYILEAKNESKYMITEGADLVYHFLLSLTAKGLSLTDIVNELEKRHKNK